MKNPKYLKWIRQLPCCLCGDNTSVEAAHISFGDRRAGKPPKGHSSKAADMWAIPLCGAHHRQQHKVGESHFWRVYDPIRLAMALWIHQHDTEKAEDMIEAWRTYR